MLSTPRARFAWQAWCFLDLHRCQQKLGDILGLMWRRSLLRGSHVTFNTRARFAWQAWQQCFKNNTANYENKHLEEINYRPALRACKCKSAYSFHDHSGLFSVTSMTCNPNSESYHVAEHRGEAPHDRKLACEHLMNVERSSSLS